MAILSHGILGAPVGRVGPVTGYFRSGKVILRPAKNNGRPIATPSRLAQQEKMRVCTEFTKAFSGTRFFSTTFPAYGHGGSGYNRAMSGLLNLAVYGNYPGQYLSLPKVLVARGPLPAAENATVTTDSAGNCVFTWLNNGDIGTARDSDRVILAAYCPTNKQAVFSLNAGQRSDEHALLNVSSFTGEECATWISFLNGTNDVADSVWCGMAQIG